MCVGQFSVTYFLATPLGTDLSSSGAMASDKVDPKIDATPIDIKYEDIPEEMHKQFEAAFQKEQEDAKKRLLACFERLGKACSRRRNSTYLHSHRHRRTHLLRLQLLLRLLSLQVM